MILTRERLAGAMTPEQYLEQMQENRALFEANLAAVRLTDEERAPFARLPSPLTVLVLTEDWCGDSAANLPIVMALAQETGKLEVRILKREGNEDITDNYTVADGRNHIPTYIVLADDLNEVGHFIERPAAITEKLGVFRSEWFAARPHLGSAETPIGELSAEAREQFLPAMRAFRAEHQGLERREMAAAFARMAERVFATA
ncbi:MAG: thioredoxin family protein [Dehalococcoidia bacterium]